MADYQCGRGERALGTVRRGDNSITACQRLDVGLSFVNNSTDRCYPGNSWFHRPEPLLSEW